MQEKKINFCRKGQKRLTKTVEAKAIKSWWKFKIAKFNILVTNG